MSITVGLETGVRSGRMCRIFGTHSKHSLWHSITNNSLTLVLMNWFNQFDKTIDKLLAINSEHINNCH